MRVGRAHDRERDVTGEQFGALAPQAQRPRDHQQLGRAGIVDTRHPSAVQAGEQFAAALDVHRAPVVGVDQREVPQLGALVHVRHAGTGQVQQRGGERVGSARRDEVAHDALHDRARRAESGIDQRVHARLERLIGIGPAGADVALARRLLGVCVQPLGEGGIVRPCAHDRLPQQRVERTIAGGALRTQRVERRRPAIGHLREHRQACADIGGAFRVVRRQGRQRSRPRRLPTREGGVQTLDRQSELRRIAAHLGERGEARVSVEGAIFDTFGHHRPGRLHETTRQLGRGVRDGIGDLGERIRQVGTPKGCRSHGIREHVGAGGKIRAVDGEGCQQLRECVARAIVAQTGPQGRRQAADEPPHLRRLRRVGDLPLGPGDHVGPTQPGAAQPLVLCGESRLTDRVDEHAVDLPERVVAGGARRRPPARQLLAGLEDLLHVDGEAASRPGAARLCDRRGERVEIAAWIGEAVGVVDAQAVDEPLSHPSEDLDVRRREHVGQLHAHPRERGHREETAVVELRGIPPPRREPPVLAFEHVANGRAVGRRVQRRRAGCEGEDEVVVAGRPGLVVGGRRPYLDLAGAEHLVEVAAQHRQHDAFGAVRPIDVEALRESGSAPVGQDVPPPRVLGRIGNALMVRHDVDEDAEARGPCGVDEALEPSPAAPIVVHSRRVDDVVAVVGAGGRLQDRRQVCPVDAEIAQVVGDGGGGIQVERRTHLQTVGGCGKTAAVGDHGQCGSSVCGAGERTMSIGTVSAASDAATEWSTSGLSS